MNILGMGPLEILLIVVLALIVFGPAKLPEIMGQVGKAIADFRRATSELSDEFNRTIQAELQETKSIVADTKSAVTGSYADINAAISGTPASSPSAQTPAPALTTAAPAAGLASSSNGSSTTNGTTQEDAPVATRGQWSWETAAPAPAKPAVEVGTTEANPEPTTPPPARKTTRRDDLLPPY
jgi:sec-independent protein translocase protein TatB